MKNLTALIFILSLTLISCAPKKDSTDFALNGTWTLERTSSPTTTQGGCASTMTAVTTNAK